MPQNTNIHQSAREYVEVCDQIAAAEANLKDLKRKRDTAMSDLMDEMIEQGIPSLDVQVGKQRARVFPRTQLWARRSPDVDDSAFIKAFHTDGLDDIVRETVNTHSLSAVVREIASEMDATDHGESAILEAVRSRYPEIARTITVSTAPKLSIRRQEAN